MDNVPMLTILGVLPLIGALLAFVVRGKAGKQLAMAVALITLAFGLVVFFGSADSDLAETVSWIPQIGAWYALSLDGMGRAMVLLTVILLPIVLPAMIGNIAKMAARIRRRSSKWQVISSMYRQHRQIQLLQQTLPVKEKQKNEAVHAAVVEVCIVTGKIR